MNISAPIIFRPLPISIFFQPDTPNRCETDMNRPFPEQRTSRLPTRTVAVPFRNNTMLSITVPVDPEALLDTMTDEDYEKDQLLPYWAEQWPASRPLLEFLSAMNLPDVWLVCELGCGLGTVSAALSSSRSSEALTTATDISFEGCRFTAGNIRNNGGVPGVFCSDWRHPPLKERFDAVIASDVLYEERWIAPIIDCIDRLLKPDGRAWIADPCRRFWPKFKERVMERGFCYKIVAGPAANIDGGSFEIMELTRQ